jgi:hypothetical protein
MDESEVLRFEQQKQITKLSQAIREGAKLRPFQCKGNYFDGAASCAIGAARDALGCDSTLELRVTLRVSDNVIGEVIMWNDSGMTREAIADKLEAMGF